MVKVYICELSFEIPQTTCELRSDQGLGDNSTPFLGMEASSSVSNKTITLEEWNGSSPTKLSKTFTIKASSSSVTITRYFPFPIITNSPSSTSSLFHPFSFSLFSDLVAALAMFGDAYFKLLSLRQASILLHIFS